MLFSSIPFLYYFLPAVVILYFLVPKALKNAVLLPLANPLLAVLCTALNLLPVILLLVSVEVFASAGFFWLVIGGSLTAVINSRLLGILFFKFVPEESETTES